MIFVGRDDHAVVPHMYFGNINFIKTVKLYVVTCMYYYEWAEQRKKQG